MGCGCNKKSTVGAGQTAQSRRVTIYQVLASGNVVSEHESLPSARQEAVSVGGRVKVTSKIVQ
jgi:hypothetical protein